MAKRKRLSPAVITAPEPGADLGRVGQGAGRPPIADVSGDAATQSAFEEVAEELRRARVEGRMVLRLPLSALEVAHLVRDRLNVDAEDMAILRDSLRARGQQTPIEVMELEGGRYGLISGWRRVMALRDLAEHEDADRFGHVQALVRTPDTAAEAYCAMVEENEIRADLSFYERARIAVQAAGQGIYPDTRTAVHSLFAAARAPKRSKTLSFAALVEALDDHLRFPAMIPEKLGLALVSALQSQPAFKRTVTEALRKAAPETAAAERALLERALRAKTKAAPPSPAGDEVSPGLQLRVTKGRLSLSGPAVDAALEADLRAWLSARKTC